MKINIPFGQTEFSYCLPRFIDLIGVNRWDRRIAGFNADAESSPFLWKIVTDYHWLEICLGYQQGSLQRRGSVLTEEYGKPDIAALAFAASVVRIYEHLSPTSKRQIVGRLRDCLKSPSGFASLYLEIDIATRLMSWGYDVIFPDIYGTGNYDLAFERDGIVGEVECKSLSVDAGRQIHRRDFYRLIDAIRESMAAAAERGRIIVVVNLEGRLVSAEKERSRLKACIEEAIMRDPGETVEGEGFKIERPRYESCLPEPDPGDSGAFLAHCQKVFGSRAHIAGGIAGERGCLVVVRSDREDDTSKPWLEAMRKGSCQLSGTRPGFLVVQLHDIEPEDILKLHLRRRAALLSADVFFHRGHKHVNASIVQGYKTFASTERGLSKFAFSILNPEPTHNLPPGLPEPLMTNTESAHYVAAMDASIPGHNLNYISAKQLSGE